MSVFLDISAALDTRIGTLSGGSPIAYMNKRYEPTEGTLYLRPTMLPAETFGAVVGSSADGGKDMQTGLYQIDVFAPSDEGKNEAYTKADAIADHFKPVTELTYNGRIVRCVSVSIEPAIQDGGWYQVPVVVRYRAYTAKR